MTTAFHPTTTQSAAFDANRTPARHAAEATLREHGKVPHKQALRKQGLAALPMSLGLGLGLGLGSRLAQVNNIFGGICRG